MGYERYPRNNPQGDYYGRQEPQDYGRDYGSGRQGSYSSARDYAAAGEYGRGRDDDRGEDRSDYGRSDHGRSDYGRSTQGSRDDWRGGGDRYGQREQMNRGSQGRYGQSQDSGYYQSGQGPDRQRSGGGDYGNRYDRERSSGNRDRGDYGRQPQGYDYEERGFFARAGDEVRSWFGDDDAERRRERDMREDERQGGNRWSNDRDDDYHSWRSGQIAALDRDYDEYRRENRTKFENEFGSWRTQRQGQRDSVSKVKEHMEVVGSDGEHVGTVDHVRGDNILLTKNDTDAGGRHHTIPSRWVSSVDDKVTLSKTAAEAKKEWRDAEQNQAMFGQSDTNRTATASRDENSGGQGGRMLNKSFSGTY